MVSRVALLTFVVALVGCADDPSKPQFQEIGSVEGQVTYYDDGAPARVVVRQFEPGTTHGLGREWAVDVDTEGRFRIPLPDGHFGLYVIPGASDYSNAAYATPWGYRSVYDPDSCAFVIARELPPAGIEAELGRLTVQMEVPLDSPRSWRLNLRTPYSNLDWSRSMSQAPESGTIQFDVTRLPMTRFSVSLTSPYGEVFLPDVFLGDTPTRYVLPDAQALEAYRVEAPTPTWTTVRTNPIGNAPEGLFDYDYGFGGAIVLTGSNFVGQGVSVSTDGTWASAEFPIFGRSPFILTINDFYVGLEGATSEREQAKVFYPSPGNTIEAELEVGAIVCHLGSGFLSSSQSPSVTLTRNGTFDSVTRVNARWDETSRTHVAKILCPPGSFNLFCEPPSNTPYPDQWFEGRVEVEAGQSVTVEWALNEGASLYGTLGRQWQDGDVLELREVSGRPWFFVPELGPDRLQFALHNVSDGYFLLRHERGNDRIYYPGSRDVNAAEVIHVTGGQDIHGLDFRL